MSYIAKQPNGLLCRYSSVVDCPTVYNMTEDDYFFYRLSNSIDEILSDMENIKKNRPGYVYPYDNMKKDFVPNNMTKKEFKEICKTMESPATNTRNETFSTDFNIGIGDNTYKITISKEPITDNVYRGKSLHSESSFHQDMFGKYLETLEETNRKEDNE